MVVEDDFSTRKFMEAVLTENGFHPIPADNGAMALRLLETQSVDMIITDIIMPGVDGFSLTEQLRESRYTLPILIVSSKAAMKDKKKGFLVGTDDYMVKPVDEEELILRVKALLRRAQIVNERKIVVGDVTLNYDYLTVTKKHEKITLPQKEFYLLYKMLSYPDKIFTRLQLLEDIWGYDTESGDSTVTVHINRLRERFSDWPEFEIMTIRGLGYKAVKHD